MVEYVPQYDEQLTPCSIEPSERLVPVPSAMPAPSVGPKTLAEMDDPTGPGNSSNSTPSVLPSAKDVETDLAPESVVDAVGFANASGCQEVAVKSKRTQIPSSPRSWLSIV